MRRAASSRLAASAASSPSNQQGQEAAGPSTEQGAAGADERLAEVKALYGRFRQDKDAEALAALQRLGPSHSGAACLALAKAHVAQGVHRCVPLPAGAKFSVNLMAPDIASGAAAAVDGAVLHRSAHCLSLATKLMEVWCLASAERDKRAEVWARLWGALRNKSRWREQWFAAKEVDDGLETWDERWGTDFAGAGRGWGEYCRAALGRLEPLVKAMRENSTAGPAKSWRSESEETDARALVELADWLPTSLGEKLVAAAQAADPGVLHRAEAASNKLKIICDELPAALEQLQKRKQKALLQPAVPTPETPRRAVQHEETRLVSAKERLRQVRCYLHRLVESQPAAASSEEALAGAISSASAVSLEDMDSARRGLLKGGKKARENDKQLAKVLESVLKTERLGLPYSVFLLDSSLETDGAPGVFAQFQGAVPLQGFAGLADEMFSGAAAYAQKSKLLEKMPMVRQVVQNVSRTCQAYMAPWAGSVSRLPCVVVGAELEWPQPPELSRDVTEQELKALEEVYGRVVEPEHPSYWRPQAQFMQSSHSMGGDSGDEGGAGTTAEDLGGDLAWPGLAESFQHFRLDCLGGEGEAAQCASASPVEVDGTLGSQSSGGAGHRASANASGRPDGRREPNLAHNSSSNGGGGGSGDGAGGGDGRGAGGSTADRRGPCATPGPQVATAALRSQSALLSSCSSSPEGAASTHGEPGLAPVSEGSRAAGATKPVGHSRGGNGASRGGGSIGDGQGVEIGGCSRRDDSPADEGAAAADENPRCPLCWGSNVSCLDLFLHRQQQATAHLDEALQRLRPEGMEPAPGVQPESAWTRMQGRDAREKALRQELAAFLQPSLLGMGLMQLLARSHIALGPAAGSAAGGGAEGQQGPRMALAAALGEVAACQGMSVEEAANKILQASDAPAAAGSKPLDRLLAALELESRRAHWWPMHNILPSQGLLDELYPERNYYSSSRAAPSGKLGAAARVLLASRIPPRPGLAQRAEHPGMEAGQAEAGEQGAQQEAEQAQQEQQFKEYVCQAKREAQLEIGAVLRHMAGTRRMLRAVLACMAEYVRGCAAARGAEEPRAEGGTAESVQETPGPSVSGASEESPAAPPASSPSTPAAGASDQEALQTILEGLPRLALPELWKLYAFVAAQAFLAAFPEGLHEEVQEPSVALAPRLRRLEAAINPPQAQPSLPCSSAQHSFSGICSRGTGDTGAAAAASRRGQGVVGGSGRKAGGGGPGGEAAALYCLDSSSLGPVLRGSSTSGSEAPQFCPETSIDAFSLWAAGLQPVPKDGGPEGEQQPTELALSSGVELEMDATRAKALAEDALLYMGGVRHLGPVLSGLVHRTGPQLEGAVKRLGGLQQASPDEITGAVGELQLACAAVRQAVAAAEALVTGLSSSDGFGLDPTVCKHLKAANYAIQGGALPSVEIFDKISRSLRIFHMPDTESKVQIAGMDLAEVADHCKLDQPFKGLSTLLRLSSAAARVGSSSVGASGAPPSGSRAAGAAKQGAGAEGGGGDSLDEVEEDRWEDELSFLYSHSYWGRPQAQSARSPQGKLRSQLAGLLDVLRKQQRELATVVGGLEHLVGAAFQHAWHSMGLVRGLIERPSQQLLARFVAAHVLPAKWGQALEAGETRDRAEAAQRAEAQLLAELEEEGRKEASKKERKRERARQRAAEAAAAAAAQVGVPGETGQQAQQQAQHAQRGADEEEEEAMAMGPEALARAFPAGRAALAPALPAPGASSKASVAAASSSRSAASRDAVPPQAPSTAPQLDRRRQSKQQQAQREEKRLRASAEEGKTRKPLDLGRAAPASSAAPTAVSKERPKVSVPAAKPAGRAAPKATLSPAAQPAAGVAAAAAAMLRGERRAPGRSDGRVNIVGYDGAWECRQCGQINPVSHSCSSSGCASVPPPCRPHLMGKCAQLASGCSLSHPLIHLPAAPFPADMPWQEVAVLPPGALEGPDAEQWRELLRRHAAPLTLASQAQRGQQHRGPGGGAVHTAPLETQQQQAYAIQAVPHSAAAGAAMQRPRPDKVAQQAAVLVASLQNAALRPSSQQLANGAIAAPAADAAAWHTAVPAADIQAQHESSSATPLRAAAPPIKRPVAARGLKQPPPPAAHWQRPMLHPAAQHSLAPHAQLPNTSPGQMGAADPTELASALPAGIPMQASKRRYQPPHSAAPPSASPAGTAGATAHSWDSSSGHTSQPPNSGPAHAWGSPPLAAAAGGGIGSSIWGGDSRIWGPPSQPQLAQPALSGAEVLQPGRMEWQSLIPHEWREAGSGGAFETTDAQWAGLPTAQQQWGQDQGGQGMPSSAGIGLPPHLAALGLDMAVSAATPAAGSYSGASGPQQQDHGQQQPPAALPTSQASHPPYLPVLGALHQRVPLGTAAGSAAAQQASTSLPQLGQSGALAGQPLAEDREHLELMQAMGIVSQPSLPAAAPATVQPTTPASLEAAAPFAAPSAPAPASAPATSLSWAQQLLQAIQASRPLVSAVPPIPAAAAGTQAWLQQAPGSGAAGSKLALSPTVTGLSNEAGEYNCFLNAIIQCLWRCADFRQQVASWTPEQCKREPVAQALRGLFAAFEQQESERQAVAAPAWGGASQQQRSVMDPTPLREALSQLQGPGEGFRVGEMADAGEVLLAIFGRIEALGSQAAAALGETFGLGVHEYVYCDTCYLESHSHSYTQYFYNTQATGLRKEKQRQAGRSSSMGALMRAIEDQGRKSCDTDLGGCNLLLPVVHGLVAAPRVFVLQLAWESQAEEPHNIAATLAAVDERVEMHTVYRGVPPGQHTYRLQSLVCYYGAHYLAFVLLPEAGAWYMFDDTRVMRVGAWADVRAKCEAGRIQPVLVFYQAMERAG